MGVNRVTSLFKDLVLDEKGQGMAEYGLILAGVAILVLGAVFGLGGKIKTLLEGLNFTAPAS